MKTITNAQVLGHEALTPEVKKIKLYAPAIAEIAQPGQFVTLAVTKQLAPLLRRPFGIAAVDVVEGSITLVYRLLGEATHILAQAKVKDVVNVMGPLGHGFDLKATRPLLVGGGMGLAPLHFLATCFSSGRADVLMGGKTAGELFWQELYANKVNNIFLTTDDGSLGVQGTVLATLPQLLQEGKYDCLYVCGPVPMMKAVVSEVQKVHLPCQISLEKYMGCGLGACLSCSCEGLGKRLKVCTDGPVFWAQEVAQW